MFKMSKKYENIEYTEIVKGREREKEICVEKLRGGEEDNGGKLALSPVHVVVDCILPDQTYTHTHMHTYTYTHRYTETFRVV